MKPLGVAVVFLLGLAGCAEQLAVTYNCDPIGAAIYSGTQKVGHCPKTLYYTITDENRERGSVIPEPVTIRYVSGVTWRQKESPVFALEDGLHYRFDVVRPRNRPGYEKDVRYGLAYERNQLLRKQANAQERAANTAEAKYWEDVFSDAFSPLGAGPKLQPSCSSQVIGDQILTNCY